MNDEGRWKRDEEGGKKEEGRGKRKGEAGRVRREDVGGKRDEGKKKRGRRNFVPSGVKISRS